MKKIIPILFLVFIASNTKTQCWTSMDAGAVHSMALYYNSLWTWGYNCCGQLGNGSTGNVLYPIHIGTTNDWESVSGDTFHSLGIKTDGTLWAWGENAEGELGDGTFINQSNPIQIGTDTDWKLVSAGYEYSFAMKNDNTIWGWGTNGYSELGTIPSSPVTTPTQIGTDNDWKIIKSGYRTGMGIKQDSTLWLWGSNSWGQVGNGTQIVQNTPFQVGTSKWTDVSIVWNHTLAIKSDGTLWAWGNNFNQKLGDSLYTDYNYLLPLQIGTDSDWLKIHAGYSHSIGLKTDGTLWTWGVGGAGQLGDTTSGIRIEPVQVGVKNNWKNISCGQHFNMALDDADSLFTWGLNIYGALGDSTVAYRHEILPISCADFIYIPTPQNNIEKLIIYPNPFSFSTTLQLENHVENATLTIFNSYGQIVKEISQLSGQSILVSRDNLPNGLYFFRLIQNDQLISEDKLVIVD